MVNRIINDGFRQVYNKPLHRIDHEPFHYLLFTKVFNQYYAKREFNKRHKHYRKRKEAFECKTCLGHDLFIYKYDIQVMR